jgi:moderate conductance mechanosensitive channel
MQNALEAKGQIVQNVLGGWKVDVARWIEKDAPKFVVVLVIAFILVRLLRLITSHLEGLGHHAPPGIRAQQLRTLAGIVGSVGAFIIYFLALMQVLPLFGIDMKPVLASAGIVGLAVGFGAQTVVKDVINGFFILFENQYDIGDLVRIAGVQGTVEAMTLRRTILRDADGTVHITPNSEIHVVSNLTRDWNQVSLKITADYNEHSDRVIKILQEVSADIYAEPAFKDALVAEPEVPGIERVTGSEVEYLMTAKVKPGEQHRVSRELRKRIKQCFQENGIKTASQPKIFLAEKPGGDQAEVK